MGKVIFVSYASSSYKKNIFWNKLFVWLFIRPDVLIYLTDDDLKKTDIYKHNKDVFEAPVGGGYWAWKPWVILKAIESASEGDVVLYHDCGKGLKYKNFKNPENIIRYALVNGAMPGILIPIHGKNKMWTHSKCFELMGCCDEKYYESAQVEASISAWKVNSINKEFVQEWLAYCLDLEVVGELRSKHDDPDDIFMCHRYDQSILTNLVIKRDLKPIQLSFEDMHFSKSMSLVDLELGKKNIINKVLLGAILRLFRMKRFLNTKV